MVASRIVPFVIALGIAVSTTVPSYALEHASSAPSSEEASSVAALKIGKVGSFGNCTGTLISDQWVVTARHCLQSTDNQGSQVRLGGKVYNVDAWAVSPVSDVGLLRLEEKVTDIHPADIADRTPQEGEKGNFYGWSNLSRMARKNQLPVSEMKVEEVIGQIGGGSEGAAQFDEKAIDFKAEIPSGENEEFPAESAAAPMLMGGTLMATKSVSGAGVQAGDSGGPFFVEGRLAGVMTAGTDVGNPDLPSQGAAITALSDSKDWIQGIVSGRDAKSIVTQSESSIPAVPQTAGEHMWFYLAIAVLGLIGATVFQRFLR